MRHRSIAGPLIMLTVGGLFLWHNLRPEWPLYDMLARYWPFLLIGWGLVRLVEVLAWREPGRGGGLTGGEVVLIVLVCIAGSALYQVDRQWFRFAPRSIEVFGQQFDYPVTANAPVSGATRVVFDNPRGNLRVTGRDTAQITVSGRKLVRAYNRSDADRTDRLTPIEIVTQGDRILIRTRQERTPSGQRVSHDLEVSVPRQLTIEARNTSGDYDVSEVAGSVELASDRSDVRLNRIGGNARLDLGRSGVVRLVDVKGTVDLQGRGTDVEMEGIQGQVTIGGSYGGTLDFRNLAKPLHYETRTTELRLAALPGQITMDLGEFSGRNIIGPLRLVTKSRDIKIEDFTQSLELETERGDVELTPSRLPLAKIDARSRTGRIDLVLPEQAAFSLEATAEHGDATNDYGPAIDKQVEGRSATLKGKVGNGQAIKLTADRGSISVRKAGRGAPAAGSPAPAAAKPGGELRL